jgi:hypothetical protein
MTQSGVGGWAIAALVSCVGLTAAAATATQSAPPVPQKIGTASGMVQAGTTKITLTHAYASGPIGEGDPVYQIVLTDAPVPDDALPKELLHRGGQTLLRSGKINGIAILVDKTGFARNVVPFVGQLRGNQMLASAGQLKTFAADEGRATGQGSLTAEQSAKQAWSYSASWNAAVRGPSAK